MPSVYFSIPEEFDRRDMRAVKLSRIVGLLTLASMVGSGTALAAPAAGKMSFFACHKEFQSAKKNGTLNGQNYAAFKATHCSGAGASSSATSAPSPKPAPSTPLAAISNSNAVFPSRLAPEFASLSAGKARYKTCLKQYNANKAGGGNGSLKWIQRGGGYYSQCNTRLKSASAP